MSSNLVIVESPHKAKTISKFLGAEYVVKATRGHILDLPKSTIGVDIEANFEPEYIPLPDKEELIAKRRRRKPKPYIWQLTRTGRAKPSPGT